MIRLAAKVMAALTAVSAVLYVVAELIPHDPPVDLTNKEK